MRLRTLPLSVSGVIVGTTIAGLHGPIDMKLFALALCTSIGFQITSNLANDYGDGVKGTDNAFRIGPKRALQSGLLSPRELKKGIIISGLLNFIFVLTLLYFAFGAGNMNYFIVFLVLGFASIWAAIRYTVGTSAYGYRGMGDIFVFIFFGLVAVVGSMFLFTKTLYLQALLPACTMGFLSVGVLNLNNLRDCDSDRQSGKNTLVVRMGFKNGKIYHLVLIIAAFAGLSCFVVLNLANWWHMFSLLVFIPIFFQTWRVYRTKSPIKLDPELKKLALGTFVLAVVFFISFNNFL